MLTAAVKEDMHRPPGDAQFSVRHKENPKQVKWGFEVDKTYDQALYSMQNKAENYTFHCNIPKTAGAPFNMKHGVKVPKLNRNPQDRARLLRSLATSLFLHERIETTLARAKALKPYAERCLTLARRQPTSSGAFARLMERLWPVTGVVGRLLKPEFLRQFDGRAGGLIRVMRAGNRAGDCAPMAVVELVKSESTK